MLNTYVPVLIAFVLASLIALFMVGIGWVVGPRHPTRVKGEPFECGIPSLGTVGERYSVRFFLTAVLFLLFDVEAVFLFPWATIFREFIEQGNAIFVLSEMAFFLGILLLGLFYVWKKGALHWER